eukprot:TRINITY_DN37124_c0_g1_i1.p1 TRINITY_DN37124_c0_g1~~TRINITY_DN37124_c0_g1_i1.p1  ORF type:complete len:995 (+),score=115.66 TRINITY_DN37124_c0_g1_i1:56-3040(+)
MDKGKSRAHVDKAIADATRGRIVAVRAEGACARLSAYRACGLRALGKSNLDAANFAAKHRVVADVDIDEDICVSECAQHPDGRGLLRMDESVLMVVSETTCILQSDDEGETCQVQYSDGGAGGEVTWLCGTDLQVDLRSEATLVHLDRKLHIILEPKAERLTVLYDEGPVQQVTLTDDGRAGVRLREIADEDQGVPLEKAKETKATVAALRDKVRESLPATQGAISDAKELVERAKKARGIVIEKEEAFKAARAKVAKAGADEPVDVVLDDGFLAKVSSKRVELVQLPKEFDCAQVQTNDDGGWTWGCNGGIVSTRADGTALVQHTDDLRKQITIACARIQLMPTGDSIVAFADGSRIQSVKDNMSYHRDSISLVFSEGFSTYVEEGARSRLEDGGNFIREEDSGLSWALHNDQVVILSAGHKEALTSKAKDEPDSKQKAEPAKAENKEKPPIDFGKEGLVENGESNEPLAKARVFARSVNASKGAIVEKRTTDDDGRFALERTEDILVRAVQRGYTSEIAHFSVNSLAFCIRLWPLTVSRSFQSQDGLTLDHDGYTAQVDPGSLKNADKSAYHGAASLDLRLPSSTDDGMRIYACVTKEQEDDEDLECPVRLTFQTTATIRDGAPLPIAWTQNVDASRKELPGIKRKTLAFRSIFSLPGQYIPLDVVNELYVSVTLSLRPLLQRSFQRDPACKHSLAQPRLHITHTAQDLRICGIVDVVEDDVPDVTPILLEEAKKEGPLQSALTKCKVKDVRLVTTYQEVVNWVSSGIHVDGLELPSVTKEVLVAAHAEVQLVRSLNYVAAGLSRANALSQELEAASKLKAVPAQLETLASAIVSLFTDAKKTAKQVGGFSKFRSEVKTGVLGRCIYLNPYEIPEVVIKRTQNFVAKLDTAKLKSEHPAASLVAAWVCEFAACATALNELGVSVKDKKKGYQSERDFLNVGSPVPSIIALRSPPKKDVRRVEFIAPSLGWWTVDFDSWRAAGGGAAAAKALA